MYNTRASLADRKGAAFPGNHREEVRLEFGHLLPAHRLGGRRGDEDRAEGSVHDVDVRLVRRGQGTALERERHLSLKSAEG